MEELTADLSLLVRIVLDDHRFTSDGDESSLQDLTGYVQKDPDFPFAIGCGTFGDVYRALYEWLDPRTLEVCCIKVKYLIL